ncbi:CoB--CoM heterodisulfide reductase iron-sulfur subunit A family protein [Methanosarcina sp. 1.H.A.2.2]|uniref:CoB--CoM heterodisulfide reductase iron-sulfur subunit A family protein n=1 Tax=Methanosarcina sp. 1.H.A.2.2 TaxID=1483601 RepID=UPI0006220F11|nr:CoB--CoM heterodisulfide reductase iron-sulfur subunit A family protein [Methanosarcina sp. 1.H.A.2.2]KKH45365.1 heterodisulfide reductase [Methanosarcina sp. 1.H.A.2.2]
MKTDITGAVAVVGGGIAGVQASLDLANSGYKVYLIESGPTIGGKMAQLDKTFPTSDCAACILSPKLVEASRHPNIELLTYSEVLAIDGVAGDFTVKLKKKARYVDETKCTGCGDCIEKCPKKVSDRFNEGLAPRKAIYLAFPQAVPRVMTIDPDNCIYLNKGKCGNCAKVCKRGAIDYTQKDLELSLKVGAVILAAGFEAFNPAGLEAYRPEHPDVVTSLQFERLLNASGPYHGHLQTSKGKEPKKIAFIQCVGSRNQKLSRKYCSSVCCMYAVKQAVIAKEHDPKIECAIFNIDIRAFGKGFEEFYQRAKNEKKVRFIRSRPSCVEADPLKGELRIPYEEEDGSIAHEEFDMVVLSIGIGASESGKELARIAGVGLTGAGFISTPIEDPMSTNRPGVFAAGAVQGPKDIPDTVAQASGAAAKAGALLSSARGTLESKKEFPPEKAVEGEPKVGVVVCHCGTNIGGFVNVPEVVRYADTLENVAVAREEMYACSEDAQERIKEMIAEHGLNRVLVASCTPRTHEPLFQESCRDAGLNPYLFELVNIREHCSWIHQQEPEKATEKAKDIVRMGVSRIRHLSPLYKQELSLGHNALVLGGGISGLNAALEIAENGFEVLIVEKEAELGGLLRDVTALQDGRKTREILIPLIEKVRVHPLIKVLTGSELVEVSGSVGNFKGRVRDTAGREQEVKFAVAVIATGAEELSPAGYFSYGEFPNVITQSELEAKLEGDFKAKHVVMVQCAGSRNKERPYCSRVCCITAVKNALRIKKMDPSATVHVLYREMRTYGAWEELYSRARAAGVRFIAYSDTRLPWIGEKEVRVYDEITGFDLEIDADLIVLSAPLVAPATNRQIAPMFKVPLDSNGFFLEVHIKLRPVDFATEGVFLCGTAQAPKLVDESIAQAAAAASRACTILSRKSLESSAVISKVNAELCVGCGACEAVCPYGAISLKEVWIEKQGISYKARKSGVNPALCKGCGACAMSCPTGALDQQHFRNDQLLAQVKDVFTYSEEVR